MVAFELEGVEIDRCLACEGTWLDAGELELIVELYLLSLVARDPETWKAVRPLLDRRAGGRLNPSR